MGTAVLRSHDCLKLHPHLDSRPRPPTTNPSRKKPLRSPQPAKTRPVRSKPNPSRSNPNKENSETRKPLVMGQVTILKRGEDPNRNPKPIPQSAAVDDGFYGLESSVLCSTNRLGPDPGILPSMSDLKPVYAGPAFVSSPAPSSLPFPAFFVKKNDGVSRSENATKGLRFLLGLDDFA